jgi:hypothetical protein
MTKKMWSLLLTGALIAGVFSAVPAHAAPAVPPTVNIEDAAGDANVYSGLDAGIPTTVSMGAADIQKVWLENDADTLAVNILTATNPPPDALYFEVYVAPPGADAPCLALVGVTEGDLSPSYVAVDDRDCGDAGAFTRIDGGEVIVENTEDATGTVKTFRFPRSSSDYFKDGVVLAQPSALVRLAADSPQGSVYPGLIDTTPVGTDYTVSSGGAPTAPPVVSEPPGKNDPPGQGNQNCAKIKNKKKKKACKKNNGKTPPGDKCAAYVPGEQGAEAETVSVTDEHTAEAPLEVVIEQEMGMGGPVLNGVPPDQTSHVFKNLQVDSKASEAGLFIRYQFPEYEDHDLYVNYADGTEAAHVGGFNATPVGPFDGTGSGGHSEHGAEQIDGLRTPDCGGYTVDFSNFLGEGGEYTVLMWLGEAENDPAAPAKAVN